MRELENAVERGAVWCEGDRILPRHLPPGIVHGRGAPARPEELLTRSLAQVEHDHIRAVLSSCGGNKARASTILGISSTTLWRKLKETGR